MDWLTRKMIQVVAIMPIPKYGGSPEDLDEFKLTWNKYVNDSTMGFNEAQRQRFSLSMLPDCVQANMKKELDDWLQSHAGRRVRVDCKDKYQLELVLQLNNTPQRNGHTMRVEKLRPGFKPEDIYALAYKDVLKREALHRLSR